jgi:hypothetical protein
MKNVVNYCPAHMIHYSYMHVRIKYITQKLSLIGHAHCIDNWTFYIASYTAVLYGEGGVRAMWMFFPAEGVLIMWQDGK